MSYEVKFLIGLVLAHPLIGVIVGIWSYLADGIFWGGFWVGVGSALIATICGMLTEATIPK